MFYSKSTGGFYSTEIHGSNIPEDAVEITIEQHVALLEAQTSGKVIAADNKGNPIALDPPPLSPEQLFILAAAGVRVALQSEIDAKAKVLGFSGGNALMLYASFTNPFKATALPFAQWEASAWAEAEAYKQEVIAGTKPMLSPIEAVAMMPILNIAA